MTETDSRDDAPKRKRKRGAGPRKRKPKPARMPVPVIEKGKWYFKFELVPSPFTDDAWLEWKKEGLKVYQARSKHAMVRADDLEKIWLKIGPNRGTNE